jgi:hypothetical protein
MSDERLDRWFQHLRGELPGGLDELLHDDCIFLSPIVFTPQRGKELTKAYLGAAGQTLGGDGHEQVTLVDDGAGPAAEEGAGGGFRYVKVVASGDHAVLEFETTMGGTYVNGVDIITFDDDGRIVEFKVMIRPLRAVNEVHAAMRAMLEQMAAADD